MRTLVFDGRTGAAGDMICAALIAAGADPTVLDPVRDALPIRYEVGEAEKNGIRATTVDVLVNNEVVEPVGTFASPCHTHDHVCNDEPHHARGHTLGHDHTHKSATDSP